MQISNMEKTITEKYSLYQGDCLNILQRIENKTIKLCLCDLPYGVLNKSNKAAQWDKPIDLKLLWKELKRVGTDNCAFIFFASGLFTHDLEMAKQRIENHVPQKSLF